MGRKKRSPPPAFATKKRTWERNHYIMLFDDQLNSPAYINLSAPAKMAYTILRQEYKGEYSGAKVICPYSSFEKKGMRANTLSNALLQLEVFGFIKVDHGGLEHKPNVYYFSEEWKKIETEADVAEAKAMLKESKERKLRAAREPTVS